MANSTICNSKSQHMNGKPIPEDYIPTRITFGCLDSWLAMTQVAQNLYIIIAGSPGAGGTGFVTSINCLTGIYQKRVKKRHSWNRIQKGIEELVSNGWITQKEKTSNAMVILIPKSPGQKLDSIAAIDHVSKLPQALRLTSSSPIEVSSIAAIEATSSSPIEPLNRSDCTLVQCRSSLVETTAATDEVICDPPSSLTSTEDKAAVAFLNSMGFRKEEASPGDHAPSKEPATKDKELKLCHRVRNRFKNSIPLGKIMDLIASTSLENVQNQLDWFSHRRTKGFREGEPAAFVTFCRDEVGEPPASKAMKLENERKRTEKLRLIEAKKANDYKEHSLEDDKQRYKWLLEQLPSEQIEQARINVIETLGEFYQGEDTHMYTNMFRGAILVLGEHLGKMC